DGYGVRGFVRDNLPIIPDTFTLVPRQVRTEKGYKPDSGVVSQIKVIKRRAPQRADAYCSASRKQTVYRNRRYRSLHCFYTLW
ncbi:hypothetical protein RAN97_09410, partial [Ornithobacterium rhinotracheale]